MVPHIKRSVFEQFLDIPKRNESQLAVQDSEGSYSYGELMAAVELIAANLQALGVKSGDVVAVSTGRNRQMLALLLAIWALDATYVPIDPIYPLRRKAYILDDAQIGLCIVDDSWFEALQASTNFIWMPALLQPVQADTPPSLDGPSTPERLAYIIYTSGSTGKPKGVMVTQRNLSNFISSMSHTPGMTSTDRLLAVTTISFDIHILELFLPLSVGASLYLANSDEILSAAVLRTVVDQHSINFIQATPALWRIILDPFWQPRTAIKALIGGEALPADLIPKFAEKNMQLWNMYGPTETTVWSLCHRVAMDRIDKIYIGQAIDNTELKVVDSELKEVAAGETGELLIGGAGVSDGYLNKPALTQAKFVRLSKTSPLWYRTGDLVRRSESGAFEYVNRIDNLIKLRGHRIEPTEVERAFSEFPGVDQAVMVLATLSERDKRLVLFYTGTQLEEPIAQLQQFIAEYCPHYMVPSNIFWLSEFEKTDNLKIDRNALTALAKEKISSLTRSDSTGPRNQLERSVVDIWSDVLRVSKIGIDENFFELGGDSISAIQAVEKMNAIEGLRFSVADLFDKPTVKSLVNECSDISNKEVVIIGLDKSRQGTPCFGLCGVNVYQQLAHLAEQTGPFYGVFANQEIAYLSGGADQMAKGLDSTRLVDAYADAIAEEVGEQGKAILVGFSFGGDMSLEVAKKLAALGVVVEAVVLIDSYNKGSYFWSTQQALKDLWDRGKASGYLTSSAYLVRRAAQKVMGRLKFIKSRLSRSKQTEVFERLSEDFNMSAEPFSGRVLLIRSELPDFHFGMAVKEDYGWGEHIDGTLVIRPLRAAHDNMLRQPAVVSLAKEIGAFLVGQSAANG